MSTLTISSETLFSRALEGDPEALDQLLREHRDSITAVCRRRLRSRVDADDAVQETMVRAMGALSSVRDETRLRSYLCRIAERVCLDMMRAGARPMPLNDPVEVEEPESLAIRREEAELVRRTLEALSERQAEALWMRDAMGEPVPAVAEHLGMTEGSTRVLLTRARRRMRDGWAKVMALVPGVGLKLPAPLAKLVATTGVVPAVIAPAAVLVAAVLVLPGLGGSDGGGAALTVQPPPPVRATGTDLGQTRSGAEPTLSAPARAVQTARSAPAPAPPPVAAAPATTSPVDVQVSTGTVDVGVSREDPGQDKDDVTAGDDEVVGVGTSVEDTMEGLGIDAPETDLSDDVTSS